MSAASRSLARRVARDLASASSTTLLTAMLAASANGAETAAADVAKALPTGGHASAQFVSAWDDDGDDKVSRAEYDGVRIERFASADKDGNGTLTADEYVGEYVTRLDPQIADEREASIKQTHTRFGALDKDQDNFVSRAEYDASGAKSFEHLDHDHDGRIVETESSEAETQAAASHPRRERRTVIRMPTSHSRAGFVEIYDADGDGVLTREQYAAERARMFAVTDTDSDGKLDRTEYVNEFAGRLDRQIADSRQAQLKQGKVRFNFIDDDKNGAIGRDEYFAMSARMFERADTNKDGVVSAADPAPPARERRDAAVSNDGKPARELSRIKVTVDEEGRSTAGNTKVVGVAQLEEEQAQNFEDAIRYIPGVSIVDMGRFGDNGFNIRGLEGDRVAITVDGLSFAEAVETTPAYEFFRAGRGSVDIDSLKSIEVVKGADSITAGSGALGGAVMFTTKDPYDYLNADGGDSYFRVKTGYTSSSDELMTTATLANRTGMVESMVLYTRRRGHEAESWYDSSPVVAGSQRRTPDPIDRDSDSVLAKVDLVLNDSHRFGLVGEHSRATNEINNLSRVGGAGYLERRAADDSDRDRYGVRYGWQDAATFFDSMEVTADRVETKSRGLTTILAGTGCAQNIVPCLRSEDRATDQVLDRAALDFSKALKSGNIGHALIYGLAWQQRDVDFVAVDTRYIGTTDATSSVTVDPDQVPKTDVASYSAYVRDSVYLLNDRLTLNAGVRYDRTEYSPRLDAQFVDTSTTVRDVDFAAATWQFSADFKFTPEHSLWAQVGRGFRAPSVGEMFAPTSTTLATEVATGNPVTLWDSVANPNLKSEESLNTELGYRWQSERHQVGISAYRDKYSNFIESTELFRNPDVAYRTCTGNVCTVTLGNAYLTPANLGEVIVKGVEVEGRWSINEQWSARLAWTYSEGEKKSGDPLPSIVPATGVLGVRYVSPSQLWTLNGNLTHADAKKLQDATITATSDFFESLVPDYLSDEYTVFDLFGEFKVTQDIRLSAGVYNLFDEQYYLWPRVRFVNEGTTTLYGYASGDGIGRFSEPGRNFRVSMAWQF